jgi:hypothetical protein
MIRPAQGALGTGHEVESLRQMAFVDGEGLVTPLFQGFESARYGVASVAVMQRQTAYVGGGHHGFSPMQIVVGCG